MERWRVCVLTAINGSLLRARLAIGQRPAVAVANELVRLVGILPMTDSSPIPRLCPLDVCLGRNRILQRECFSLRIRHGIREPPVSMDKDME